MEKWNKFWQDPQWIAEPLADLIHEVGEPGEQSAKASLRPRDADEGHAVFLSCQELGDERLI